MSCPEITIHKKYGSGAKVSFMNSRHLFDGDFFRLIAIAKIGIKAVAV